MNAANVQIGNDGQTEMWRDLLQNLTIPKLNNTNATDLENHSIILSGPSVNRNEKRKIIIYLDDYNNLENASGRMEFLNVFAIHW